jgi:hypothetical protein
MNTVICKTQALPDGSFLWCVRHKGWYNVYDPPRKIPITSRSFVLASSVDEAVEKADLLPDVEHVRKQSDETVDVTANIVIIESLVPARDTKDDGRKGWDTPSSLKEVSLSHPDDTGWRLAVCLVPVEKK